MSRSIRTATGAAIVSLLAVASVVLAAPGSAQVTPTLTLTPIGAVMVQSGAASIVGSLSVACDAVPTTAAVGVSIGGVPAPTVGVTILDASTFLLTVPAGLVPTTPTPGPIMAVTITCPIGTVSTPVSNTIGFAEIHVMKHVVGVGPAGGEFALQAVCTPAAMRDGVTFVQNGGPTPAAATFAFTLADGAGHSIFTFSPYTCAISETDALGASTSLVTPGSVTTEEAMRYPVAVVNAYPTTAPPKFTG